jgi:hypothetical protein
MAAECLDAGREVVRDNVPMVDARRLSEELKALAFDITVEE